MCPPIRVVHSVAHFPPHTHIHTHTHTRSIWWAPRSSMSNCKGKKKAQNATYRDRQVWVCKDHFCDFRATRAAASCIGSSRAASMGSWCVGALELTAEKQPCPRKRSLFFCGVHPQIVVIIDYVFDVLVAGQPVGHCDVENMLL